MPRKVGRVKQFYIIITFHLFVLSVWTVAKCQLEPDDCAVVSVPDISTLYRVRRCARTSFRHVDKNFDCCFRRCPDSGNVVLSICYCSICRDLISWNGKPVVYRNSQAVPKALPLFLLTRGCVFRLTSTGTAVSALTNVIGQGSPTSGKRLACCPREYPSIRQNVCPQLSPLGRICLLMCESFLSNDLRKISKLLFASTWLAFPSRLAVIEMNVGLDISTLLKENFCLQCSY
jgi:hypothetical protein